MNWRRYATRPFFARLRVIKATDLLNQTALLLVERHHHPQFRILLQPLEDKKLTKLTNPSLCAHYHQLPRRILLLKLKQKLLGHTLPVNYKQCANGWCIDTLKRVQVISASSTT